MRDKVTRQCPQTTNLEEKGEPKRQIRAGVPLLTSYNLTLPLGQTGSRSLRESEFFNLRLFGLGHLVAGRRDRVLAPEAKCPHTGAEPEHLLALRPEALGGEAVDDGVGDVAEEREELGQVEEGLGHWAHGVLRGAVHHEQNDSDEVRGVGQEEHHSHRDEHQRVLPAMECSERERERVCVCVCVLVGWLVSN